MMIVASINCLKFKNSFYNQIISHATIVSPLYSTIYDVGHYICGVSLGLKIKCFKGK
jgi:hypothetical protein